MIIKYDGKISLWNSKRLRRKLQKSYGDNQLFAARCIQKHSLISYSWRILKAFVFIIIVLYYIYLFDRQANY